MTALEIFSERTKGIKVTNDDTRDLAIIITEGLIDEGLIKEYDDEDDDESTFSIQDVIHSKLNKVFNVEEE